MNERPDNFSPVRLARIAGVLYLAIIVSGIFGEMVVRSALIVPGDSAATTGNIVASYGLFGAGFLADSVMVLCDVSLAVLLYVLLKPVHNVIALLAMTFRLVQAAVLALNLLHYYAPMLLMRGAGSAEMLAAGQRDALAVFFLDLHAHGYDLGLIPFGISCLLLGYLIFKSRYLPWILGALMAAAGVVYLLGSYTRFLAPTHLETISPIYIVAIVAEIGLGLWLLIRGVNLRRWKEAQ